MFLDFQNLAIRVFSLFPKPGQETFQLNLREKREKIERLAMGSAMGTGLKQL
jgi:hypothetical protein